MKIKLFVSILLLSLTSTFAFSAANDTAATAYKTIHRIQVGPAGGGNAYYYFISEGTDWGVSNCGSGVKWAYISKDNAVAAAALSAALASKTTKVKMRFVGLCGNASGNTDYMRITSFDFGE